MRRWIPADRRRRSSTTAPARPVQLTTADGVRLSGIHLPAHGDAYAPAVVIAHGLTGIPKEQFAEVAKEAEGKCPVSNALRGSLTIELDAKAV